MDAAPQYLGFSPGLDGKHEASRMTRFTDISKFAALLYIPGFSTV
jgi:hypothetical protein